MANVQVVMTADEQRLFKALAKVVGKETEMATKFKEAAAAAKKAGKDMEQSFGATQINNLAKYAAGFVSVSTAIQLVNNMLADQAQLADKAAKAQGGLGKAQQETIKNLSGLTSEEKKTALTEAERIQRETGFPDINVITEAIGAGFSASGDIEKTISAVRAAAELTKLSPEQLPTVTSGALDVARGSGLTEAERNIGLLLTAGGISRIEDPTKLSTNLAPVISSGVETVPEQDRLEAARQIAAIFGGLTAGGTDRMGDSSSTAAITLISRLEQFFAKQKDDPGTIFGRIEALQQSEKLRKKFLGEKGFGEERFKGPIKAILSAGSELSNMVVGAAEDIDFDRKAFRQHAEEINKLTPQLKNALAQAASAGNIQAAETNPELGRAGTVSEILFNTLAQVRRTPLDAPSDWMNRLILKLDQRFSDRDPAEIARTMLQVRRGDLDPETERELIQLFDRQIELLKNMELDALESGEAFEDTPLASRRQQEAWLKQREDMRRAMRQAVETEEVTPPQKPDKLFPKDERIKQAAEQGGLLNIASEDKSDLRVMVNPRFELPDADKHREVLNAPLRTEPPQPNFTERRFVPDRMHAVPVVDDGDDMPPTRNPFAPRPTDPAQVNTDHGRALENAAKSLERTAALLASAMQGGRQQARTPHKPSSRAAQLQERNAQRE